MLHLVQLIKVMPFEYKIQNKQEIFNELNVYLFYYTILIVLREDIGDDRQHENGWALIILQLSVMIANMGLNIKNMIKDLINGVAFRCKRNLRRQERAETRKHLVTQLEEQQEGSKEHNETQIEINLIDLRDKISEWHDSRK